jgi:hypothetical protein
MQVHLARSKPITPSLTAIEINCDERFPCSQEITRDSGSFIKEHARRRKFACDFIARLISRDSCIVVNEHIKIVSIILSEERRSRAIIMHFCDRAATVA